MNAYNVWKPDIFMDRSKSMYMNAPLVEVRQAMPYFLHPHKAIFSPIPTYRSGFLKAEPFPTTIEFIYSLDGSLIKYGGFTTENISKPFLIH
jgi:hypothetical protein